MEELKINLQETVKAKDNLGIYKLWFNGMKHFFTIKPLPPHG